MKHSESLKEIAPALTKAQAEMDRHAEAALILRLWKAMGRSHRTNKASPPIDQLMRKVAYGASDCWYFTGHIDALGYGRINADETKAHRQAWRLFKGDIPEGMKVLHRCDVRNCVNPEHLFLGTQADNVRDMMEKGRGRTSPRLGEHSHLARLTAEQVRRMRARKQETGESYRQIADAFGVSVMTAYRAIVGQSWSNA